MAWIDSHVHVWTQDTQRYPTQPGQDLSDFEPAEFVPEHLFEHTKPSGVDRIVLVQIPTYLDNSLMIDCRTNHPGVFGIIGMVDKRRPDVGEEMARLKEQGVSGFRILGEPGHPEESLAGAAFDPMYEAAAANDQAMCPLTHPPGAPDIVTICRRHPKTKVVVDHLTRVGEMKPLNDEHIDTLCSLAQFPRVFVKLSRFHSLGAKKPPHDDLIPMIRRVVDSFGAERLMWGSDSPFQVNTERYEDSISLVRDKLDFLSEGQREQVLCKTAEGLFFA